MTNEEGWTATGDRNRRLGVSNHRALMTQRHTLALLVALASGLAQAQFDYFGKNKVQTRDYRFQSYETEHFRVLFYPGGEAIAEFGARSAEEYYRQLAADLGFELDSKTPLLLYLSPGQFGETNVITDIIEEGVGGFSELLRNRIVVPFNGSYDDLHHVIGHELVHIFEFRMFFRSRLASLLGAVDEFSIPLWVLEGFAEYQSGWVNVESELFMRDLVTAGKLVSLPDLHDGMGYLVYREGESFFRWVDERYGRRKVHEFMSTLASKRNVDAAFQSAFGASIEKVSERWERSLKLKYWPQAARAGTLDEDVDRLTDHVRDGSVYNTAPALSPSGMRVAFVSDRAEYADVYVMSAMDGKGARRVVRGGRSGGFENMHLLRPGVAWSPDEKTLAVVSTAGGRDNVALVDARSGRVARRLGGGLDGIYSPAFANSGESLAFVGLKNGFSDIYVVSRGGGAPRRVTYDMYEDRDPVFSSGGESLFFVSDRPDPGGEWIPGEYAVWCRSGSGELGRLTGRSPGLSHPTVAGEWLAWAVADSLSNIELYSLTEGRVVRRASLLGEVSYLSLSRDAANLAFALFSSVGWDIAVIRNPMDALPAVDTAVAADFGQTGREFAKSGLDFGRVKPVRFNLALDYAVGAASWNPGSTSGFTGTLNLAFSDLLGNHRFELYTDLYGDILNSDFYLAYWLLPGRVDYSAVGFQYTEIPYVNYDSIDVLKFVQSTNRGLSLGAQYPFSRFSRAELGLTGYVADTVSVVRRGPYFENGPYEYEADAAGLAFVSYASPALVFDNTWWTWEGPARGTRARLYSDFTLTSGRRFADLVFDGRNYQRLGKRFVFASRFLYARDLKRAGSAYSLGQQNVRGYDWYEFYADSARGVSLAGLELRFPFLDRVKIAFPLPLEFGGIRGVGFVDGGMIVRDSLRLWDAQAGKFDDLKLGVGAGIRVQISYFLLKFDWAKPLSVTDDPGWKFIFGIGTDF